MKQIAYILLLFFIVFTNSLLAQHYTISGTVIDENNQPISFANILLSKSNTENTSNENIEDYNTYTGVVSDENGKFEFKDLDKWGYVLQISFIGFESYTQQIHLNDNIEISVVLKESTETLNEVELVVKKPTLKRETDRLIFNVANTSLSNGNLMEVIRSTPGVLVFNNSISVNGTVPTVYINDRKVNLSSDELMTLLESSPANSIKSIEVITNPPAKYDAESGAVINIVMGKNVITGYRGSIYNNFTQGVFPRYNTGLTNFFKNDKINVYANYSFTQNKERRKSNEDIYFLDNNNEVDEIWSSNFHRKYQFKTHNINVNLDYFIDDNNTISLASNILLQPYFRQFTNSATNVIDPTQAPLFSFNTMNTSLDDKHNLGFDLDYVTQFSDNSKLSFNGHATLYDYFRDQNVNNQYFNTPVSSTSFNTLSNQDTEIYSGQIDYSLTNESSSFALGIKTSNIKTESDITRFDFVMEDKILNTDLSDAFNYDENIYAAYISYDKTWEKWNLSVGLRAEQTDVEGLSVANNETNNQDYFELFPTLNLGHDITENLKVYTNYKRSIERPNFQSLNPFQFFLNDNTIITGNPQLQPSFIDHAVFGTSINNTFAFEAYYKYTDASFIELPLQDNDQNLLLFTPTNLGSTTEYGFDFTVYFAPVNNWQVYFATSFFNIEDKATFNSELIERDTWSNYSELINNFSLLKDKSLTGNFSITYVGKNQQGFQEVNTTIFTNFSLKKSILNGKGDLSLYISDIFNKQDQEAFSNYLDQRNTRFMNIDNRYIKLGFTYKFGNTTLTTNEHSKENKERDRIKERD